MITHKKNICANEILLADAYCCRKFSGTSPFPTKRLSGIGNFIGSVISLNQSVGFDSSNYCPEKCRPKNHKDWVYCWNNKKYIEQFVKFTGHTNACNNLTNFAYVVNVMTGNGNYAKSEQVIWMQTLLSRKMSSLKIINIGFIVETTLYSIVHILGYILSYILEFIIN